MSKNETPRGDDLPCLSLFGIKPLKWATNGKTSSWQGLWAKTPFLNYTIDRWIDGGKWSSWSAEVCMDGSRKVIASGRTKNEAKRACQNHWMKTLRPVLVPNTSGQIPARKVSPQ